MQKPCGDEVLSYECPLYGSFDRQQFRFRLWASTSYPRWAQVDMLAIRALHERLR